MLLWHISSHLIHETPSRLLVSEYCLLVMVFVIDVEENVNSVHGAALPT